MEQMLDYYNIQSEQRVKVAAMHLEESPLQWYRWFLCTKRSPILWEEFETSIMAMYVEQIVSDYSSMLSKLRQERYSYEHYQDEFMHPFHQVQNLSEDYLMNYFIGGLRDVVK